MMKRKFWAPALCVVMALSAALSLGFALAEPGETAVVYEAEKVFRANTAPLSYLDDGSIQVGTGDAETGGQLWTDAGEYTFDSPISVTFRLNGIPTESGVRKDNYFFFNDVQDGNKLLWYNVMVTDGQARLNITFQDAYLMADNFALDLDLSRAADIDITIAYDAAQKLGNISYESSSYDFDLTKAATGGANEQVEKLPDGPVKLSLMNAYGGVVITRINGRGFHYEKPDLGFDAKPNLADDFVQSADVKTEITYEKDGIHVGNGDPADATMVSAGTKESYQFADGVVDLTFRFDGLQPAAETSRKVAYFILHEDRDTSRQIVVKFFAYCTTDDAATAQYILHVEAFTGTEGDGAQYFAESKNLLWDVKDFERVSIRFKYDAQNRVLKLFNGSARETIDLGKKADGTDADTTVLPGGDMRVQMMLQNGGIVLEKANAWLFAFDRADFEVHYTDRKNFFLEDSRARVAYRNGGILISNNDKSSVAYLQADANPLETYETGSMIFEYRFDSLQTYTASEPLSIMKAVWFDLSDEAGHALSLQPFLYKSGNSRLLHINVRYQGRMIYENHLIAGYDFADYENMTMFLKYDAEHKTLAIGTTLSQETIDLSRSFNGNNEGAAVDTSEMPAGSLKLDAVRVQFGGIYLRRINQYSFVVEDPQAPDPADAEITDFGLPETTFDKELTVRPTVDKGDFPDAALTLSYRLPGGEEFTELTANTDGSYSFSFGDFGVYAFRYELTFDNLTVTAERACEYKSTLIEGLTGMYGVGSGTVSVTERGLRLTSRSAETDELVYGYGKYEVAGTTSVQASIVELQPAGGTSPTMKQFWVDFSDGKNGVWVNLFAFSAAGTAGRYPAYCSVFTFKNGDKGTQMIVSENVPLGFNFDQGGAADTALAVEITYEPGKGLVTVGKAGESGTTFDLIGRDLPKGKFNVNLAGNYGSWDLLAVDGFSLANEEGAIDVPAPKIDLAGVPQVVIVGGRLAVPEWVVYDLFDLRPSFTMSLKDAAGKEVALTAETVDGFACRTATLTVRGAYTLTIAAENKKGLKASEAITVQVINEDLEKPVMTFAADAFSQYRKGDRDNKFEVKKDTTVELPTPTLTDDSGLPVDLKVTVTDPKGKVSIVSSMKFVGDTIGTYKVEYIATDVSGKETREIYNFIVKLKWDEEEQPEDGKKPGGCGGALGGVGMLGGALLLLGVALTRLNGKRKQ